MAAHLPWLVCFNRGIIAQGPPEDVLTPDTLRATYGSEMLVLRQHGTPSSPTARWCPAAATATARTEGPMEFLLEPLTYAFFQRALLASLLVGALCGLIGV